MSEELQMASFFADKPPIEDTRPQAEACGYWGAARRQSAVITPGKRAGRPFYVNRRDACSTSDWTNGRDASST
jgi:hypothetical protein